MEGLLIAEEVAKLETPTKRLSWRFPDAYTFVLPLAKGALWLFNRPPNPRVAFLSEMPSPGGTHSGFQDLLVARAVGDLIDVEQLKLDRVVRLHFGAGAGFVPVPPAVLIAELTGRNCNLILTDEHGKILGAAREIAERRQPLPAGARRSHLTNRRRPTTSSTLERRAGTNCARY